MNLPARFRIARTSRARLALSGAVLVIFFSALLVEYWSELVPGFLRLFNATRTLGAETVESENFDVRNNSRASQAQVSGMVRELERQYTAISAYTGQAPPEKLQVLVVDGQGYSLMDGEQVVINYANGRFDTDLAPLFLVFLIEEMPFDLNAGLVLRGGHALQVIEAAGQGEPLLRQPLDAWVVLIREKGAYLPLEEAWLSRVPNDEKSGALFIRAMLESGSFMGWFTGEFGLESARALVQGEDIAALTGKTIDENEAAWLQALEAKAIQPQPCWTVIPRGSFFGILCKDMR